MKKRSNRDTLRNVANAFVKSMLESGVVVQAYSSYSSNSLYVKLDYGVLGTVRFSDHKGNKMYPYKYQVRIDSKVRNKHKNGVYNPREIERLQRRILDKKGEYLNKYGEESYGNMMRKNYMTNKGSLGFWSKAKTLHPKDFIKNS